MKYVSRGGFKLEKAVKIWQIDLKDKICLDIGASTGGFTDVALQMGPSWFMRWMWATISSPGSSGMTRGWW